MCGTMSGLAGAGADSRLTLSRLSVAIERHAPILPGGGAADALSRVGLGSRSKGWDGDALHEVGCADDAEDVEAPELNKAVESPETEGLVLGEEWVEPLCISGRAARHENQCCIWRMRSSSPAADP